MSHYLSIEFSLASVPQHDCINIVHCKTQPHLKHPVLVIILRLARPPAHQVTVVGYSGGLYRQEALSDGREGEKLLKFLLYSQYKWNKPVSPAIMLFFRPPFWNVKVSPSPYMYLLVFVS